jgi:hypothetical protein
MKRLEKGTLELHFCTPYLGLAFKDNVVGDISLKRIFLLFHVVFRIIMLVTVVREVRKWGDSLAELSKNSV